jgi:hypothetical protein
MSLISAGSISLDSAFKYRFIQCIQIIIRLSIEIDLAESRINRLVFIKGVAWRFFLAHTANPLCFESPVKMSHHLV